MILMTVKVSINMIIGIYLPTYDNRSPLLARIERVSPKPNTWVLFVDMSFLFELPGILSSSESQSRLRCIFRTSYILSSFSLASHVRWICSARCRHSFPKLTPFPSETINCSTIASTECFTSLASFSSCNSFSSIVTTIGEV